MTYITDPVFLNFHDRTVNDYVKRWELSIDKIMKRKRFMNVRGDFDPSKSYQYFRGHPSYDGRRQPFVAGLDLLTTQYVGYISYARIQRFRGKEYLAQEYLKKAAEVKTLVNNTWWNEKEQCFYARLNENYQLEGNAGAGPLSRDIVEDGPKLKAVMKDVQAGRASAKILYRYGQPFTFSRMVKTISGPGTKIDWAELRNLPIRANYITVRHKGEQKTIFTNQTGPAMTWQASFVGQHETLLVNGQPMRATVETGLLNQVTSSVRVIVGSGGFASVEVPH